jgi:hypothetical protein
VPRPRAPSPAELVLDKLLGPEVRAEIEQLVKEIAERQWRAQRARVRRQLEELHEYEELEEEGL